MPDPSSSHDVEAIEPNKIKAPGPDLSSATISTSDTKDENALTETLIAGEAKYNRLPWHQLTLMLIVEAIALGSLSIPSAFATLGMIAGVICCVGVGLIAIYTSYMIGQVKLANPSVHHYGDAGTLMMGRFGYELFTIMFLLQLIFVIGSHCLTGSIALVHITTSGICSLVFGIVSAVILFLLAVPSSFADAATLGYIDFASVIIAIEIAIISTGTQATNAPGGLAAVSWSALPKENLTFSETYVAIGNIVFAYSFATCQFSFMDEMHTPREFTKSILSLGILEIAIYTITGATIYAFVGLDVQSPALLSADNTVSRVAFGIALPVIFISGSINTIVAGRLILSRAFKNSVVRYVNTAKGWAVWLMLISCVTIVAWVLAEAIPFFNDLIGNTSALFTSGFSFYIPPIMWFVLIRKGKWYSKENILLAAINAFVFIFGVAVLVCGLYSTIEDIVSTPSHLLFYSKGDSLTEIYSAKNITKAVLDALSVALRLSRGTKNNQRNTYLDSW
ncbi:N amino acid transport system protein [Penicillium antarcticum]|uniref:N amino acid transport system protein n=1 Tax=Penicillium antarcticum TaxID=416450 RepID=UPI0023A307FF|nr:N amino acid transport system protein [Penicillium antarcticum]KAJ5316824.1 N amino acid transport system protein [Penicillium antarcticum]